MKKRLTAITVLVVLLTGCGAQSVQEDPAETGITLELTDALQTAPEGADEDASAMTTKASAASMNTETVSQAAENDPDEPVDLDIDFSAFTEASEPYTEPLNCKWFYESDPPVCKYKKLTSPDGMMIAKDEEGRIVRFRNTPDRMNAALIETENGCAPVGKLNAFLSAVLPESLKVEAESAGSYYDGSSQKECYHWCEMLPNNGGFVEAQLNGDGTIEQADITYYYPQEKIRKANYDKEAETILKKFSMDHEGVVDETCFHLIDGYVYGEYWAVTGFDGEYGDFGFLVRAEHDSVPLIKEYVHASSE